MRRPKVDNTLSSLFSLEGNFCICISLICFPEAVQEENSHLLEEEIRLDQAKSFSLNRSAVILKAELLKTWFASVQTYFLLATKQPSHYKYSAPCRNLFVKTD